MFGLIRTLLDLCCVIRIQLVERAANSMMHAHDRSSLTVTTVRRYTTVVRV